MAQERSKRAETDSRRLKAQMDTLLYDMTTRTPSIRSVRMTEEIQPMQELSGTLSPTPSLLQSHYLFSAPSTPRTTSNLASASTPPSAGPSQTLFTTLQDSYGTDTPAELVVIQDVDDSNLSALQDHLPLLEQLESQKAFYEKLAEENVAMKMEIQDLRYRNKAEKDSIKGYMSLFESLQKKQSSALAVAQAEIDLLRSTIQEHILRLESRSTLIQTFTATVNSQAIELEILARDACRERAARARTEQEMASLLEASLLMLEKLFVNVDQSVRSKLARVLDPIRQTIHHLEIPSILHEWNQCEQGVQSVINELAKSLILQQKDQENELARHEEGGAGSGGEGSAGSSGDNNTVGTLVKANGGNIFGGSGDSNNSNNCRSQQSNIRSAHSKITTSSSGVRNNNTYQENRGGEDETMMILDNHFSQQVFVWRKITADMFLEECVKSVENLVQERRELQTRIVELTRIITEQDETRQLKELAASRPGAITDVEEEPKSESVATETTKRQQDKEFKNESVTIEIAENLQQQQQENDNRNEPIEAEIKEKQQNEECTNGPVALDTKEIQQDEEPTEKLESAGIMDSDQETKGDVMNDVYTSESHLSSDAHSSPDTTPLPSSPLSKGTLEESKKLTPPIKVDSVNQENHSKDQQESQPHLNTMDDQNKRDDTTAVILDNSSERTRRLELILQKVLEWSDESLQPCKTTSIATSERLRPLKKSKPSDQISIDEDIISLGISEAPSTVMRTSVKNTVKDTNNKGDLETLLQLIRQELAAGSMTPSCSVDSLPIDIPSSAPAFVLPQNVENPMHSSLVDKESSYNQSTTLSLVEPTTIAIPAEPLTVITSDATTNTNMDNTFIATTQANIAHTRTQTRPDLISTSSLSPAFSSSTCPSSTTSTPTTSLTSASSTYSTASHYFFSTTQLGNLSTPSSPGLGGIGGPDGQTLLDLDALCRDLAFRSFPTQHQWSKRSKKPPTAWCPASATLTASGLPPLPPCSTSTSSAPTC
ncbi:hypothetical protein FBU30_005040 [Linnemannia zychae]|nr:hypothetical protein FBU30_005040 [Linnemannia zychae]